MSVQVCLISWMNFDYVKNGGKKASFANPKHQYCVSQYKEHDCPTDEKRMEIIMGIQVSLISRMNFDYKENDGKKAFPTNPKQ